jgi:hypothetical protein
VQEINEEQSAEKSSGGFNRGKEGAACCPKAQ